MKGRMKMAKAVDFSQRVSRASFAPWLRRILFFAALLMLWQVIAMSGIWPDYLFPGPFAVLSAIITGFSNGPYLQAVGVSLSRLAIGYSISLVVGLVLGLLIGRNRILEETVGSLILGLQALPSVCWLPLAILWFGLSEPAIINGLKQGWTFAWRSLMAGELIFFTLSLGNLLQTGRDLNDASQVMAVMVVIIIIGVAIDVLIFGPIERNVRDRWGLSR